MGRKFVTNNRFLHGSTLLLLRRTKYIKFYLERNIWSVYYNVYWEFVIKLGLRRPDRSFPTYSNPLRISSILLPMNNSFHTWTAFWLVDPPGDSMFRGLAGDPSSTTWIASSSTIGFIFAAFLVLAILTRFSCIDSRVMNSSSEESDLVLLRVRGFVASVIVLDIFP